MRETARARQAFNDYLSMGPERSLEKLAQEYQSRTANVPTRQLSRLKRWSTDHRWQERLAEIAAAERAAIVARGIADRQNRVEALNDRWQRMQKVIDARAAANSDLTGGDTGLVVREVTYLPGGATRERHEVDTGLLKALLEHEKQAAIEVGEWEEKSQVSGSVLIREYGVPLDQV